MFRIFLLIFTSIYFLGSFISQIFTSYIPFKQSQTINVYEFLENSINKVIEELKSDNTSGTINVDYQGQVLENISYYSTGLTNFGTNSGTINTVTGVVIEAPWKVNSKQGKKLEVFIPIIEEDGQLLYIKEHKKINGINKDLDHMYLKIGTNEYFNDLNDVDNINDEGVSPMSSKLNGKYIMYRQILEKFEPTIFTGSSIPNTGTGINYVDNIFEEFDIIFNQQKIQNKKSIIYLGKDYDHDLENNSDCILVGEDLQTQIDNAGEGDELVLCKGTFEISNRLNINNKKDLTITSITKNPKDTIIKNISGLGSGKGRIFAVQDGSDNLKIEGITFDYPGDNGIKFNKNIKDIKLINNIFKGKNPISSQNISMNNAVIKGNYIHSTEGYGMEFKKGNNIQVINNKIEIDQDNKYAIDISNMNNSDSIDIINNDFIINDNKAIYLNFLKPTITFEGNYFDQDPENSTGCDPDFSKNTNTNCKSSPQFKKPISKNYTLLERSLLLGNLYIYKLNLESYISKGIQSPITGKCNIIEDSGNWRLKDVVKDSEQTIKKFKYLYRGSGKEKNGKYKITEGCEKYGNKETEHLNRTKYFLR